MLVKVPKDFNGKDIYYVDLSRHNHRKKVIQSIVFEILQVSSAKPGKFTLATESLRQHRCRQFLSWNA